MFWIITFSFVREEGEVPIFGDVPIERVERVYEYSDEPNHIRQRRHLYLFN